MSEYFDKNGDRISSWKWMQLAMDPWYSQIKTLAIPGPVFDDMISLEWTGVANTYGPNGPMIFRITLRSNKEKEVYECATLAEAEALFDQLVETHTDDHALLPRWKQIIDEL